MSDNGQQQFSEELYYIYATLDQYDVEQFYSGYQLWWTQQRLSALQEQIGRLRLEISENAQRLQQVQPPAVALATLARLQAKGVNDIDLLDRMLERGEEWLDLTMQRLDYCEQLEFIHENYIQWCELALEGAYDWIDSMRDADADTVPRPVVMAEVNDTNVEATEELLLRKLTDEEETSSVEITLKRPAVSLNPTIEETQPESDLLNDVEPGFIAASEEESVAAPADHLLQETYPSVEESIATPEASFPGEVDVEDDSSSLEAKEAVEFVPTSLHTGTDNGTDELSTSAKPEEQKPDETDTNHNPTNVQLTLQEYKKQSIPVQELKVQRRHSLRQRLLAIFWP